MSMKAKHLCGQTCLHKLVDDIMARTIAVRVAASQEEEEIAEPKPAPAATDTSLTSSAADTVPLRSLPIFAPLTYEDHLESSARIVATTSIDRECIDAELPPSRPAYNSRVWRAEAWKREQEREKRGVQGVPAPGGARSPDAL